MTASTPLLDRALELERMPHSALAVYAMGLELRRDELREALSWMVGLIQLIDVSGDLDHDPKQNHRFIDAIETLAKSNGG